MRLHIVTLLVAAAGLTANAAPKVTDTAVSAPVRGARPGYQQEVALGFGGNVFFAIWRTGIDQQPEGSFTIEGIRFDTTGKLLDPAPILIAAEDNACPVGVVFDGQNFVVVWTGKNDQLRVQYFDANGKTVGQLLNPPKMDTDGQPTVAAGGGRTLIAWQDVINIQAHVQITMLDGQGNTLVSDTPIAAMSTLVGAVFPTPAWGGSNANNFLVAWEQHDTFTTSSVEATTVDPNGKAGQVVTVAAPTKTVLTPDLAIASDGTTYVVAWTDTRNFVPTVYGRAVPFSISGPLMSADFPIATGLGVGSSREQLLDGSGQLFAAFETHDKILKNVSPLFGQRFKATGMLVDGQGVALSSGPVPMNGSLPQPGEAEARRHAIASGGGATFLVWTRSSLPLMYGDDVLASPIDLQAPGPLVPIEIGGGYAQQFARSVASNGQLFLVVWEEHGTLAANGTDVYGMRVGLDGTPIDPMPFPIGAAPGNQFLPAAAAFTGGEFLVAWADGRAVPTGDVDVWAARVPQVGAPSPSFLVSHAANSMTGDPNAQLAATVAAASNGWLVAWEDWGSGTDSGATPFSAVRSAFVDPQEGVSGQTVVHPGVDDLDNACAATATATAGGHFFVAYERPCSQNAGLTHYVTPPLSGLYGRWLASDGTLLGNLNEIPIDNSVNANQSATAPSVAALPDGSVVLAWQHAGAAGRRLSAAVFPEMGALPSVKKDDLAGVEIDAPSVAADATGTIIISWIDHSTMSASGLITGSDLQIADGPFPVVAADTFRVLTPPAVLPSSSYFDVGNPAAGDYMPFVPRATPPAALASAESGQVLAAWDLADKANAGGASRVHFGAFGIRGRGVHCVENGDCADGLCTGNQCCNEACDGVCQLCGKDGCTLPPKTDDRCGVGDGGVISCAALNTTCRTYADGPAHQCAGFGQCGVAADPIACVVAGTAPDGTPCASVTCAGGQGQCRVGICDCPGDPAPAPAGRTAPAGCAIAGRSGSPWGIVLLLGIALFLRRRSILALLAIAGCGGTGLEVDLNLKDTLFAATATARIVARATTEGFPAAPQTTPLPGITVVNRDYDGDGEIDVVTDFARSYPLKTANQFILRPSQLAAPRTIEIIGEAFDSVGNRLASDRVGATLQPGSLVNAARVLDLSCGDNCTGTSVATLPATPSFAAPRALTALASGRIIADARADVVVADAHFDPGMRPNAGRVEIHAGATELAKVSGTASRTCDGAIGAELGASLLVVDLDGKGGPDLVMGAPGAAGSRGAVYVIFDWGGSTSIDLSKLPAGAAALTGAEVGDRFGSALALLDIDGDQHPEVIAGAPGAKGGSGLLYALHGTDWKLAQAPPAPAVATIVGPSGAAVGGVLYALGDQLAVGAPLAPDAGGKPVGAAWLLSASAFQSQPGVLDQAPRWNGEGGGFGSSVLLANLDGAGTPPWLIAAAPLDGGGALFAVPAADLVPGDNPASRATRTVRVAPPAAALGSSLVRVPWPFGDGVLMGAPAKSGQPGVANLVRAAVTYSIPSLEIDTAGHPAALHIVGAGPDDGTGSALTLGDFDGNGTEDLAIGTASAVYLLSGPLL
jgi:hypothetical protein